MFAKRILTLEVILLSFCFLLTIFFSTYYLVQNEIFFNTDIARDFLLLEDVVISKKPPLIGPRSGAIDGFFHGPLWIYINIPAFIASNGNPVMVGWFWFFLTLGGTFITFLIGKKLGNTIVGLCSAVLYSAFLAPLIPSFFNPSGTLLVTPLYFYCYYMYLTEKEYKYLLLTYFLLGLLIQFQVAFGGPMLLLTTVHVLFLIAKRKSWKDLTACLILLLPLSTYILFDIRHNFLQFSSVISQIGTSTGDRVQTFAEILQNRIASVENTLVLMQTVTPLQKLLVFVSLGFIFYYGWKSNKRNMYFLFSYLFLAYWPLSFFLNGNVQGYHIFPFVPMLILLIALSYTYLPQFLFLGIYILIFGILIQGNITAMTNAKTLIGRDAGSWQFNKQLAENIFTDGEKEFGYYIYSADEYGYSPRYAMKYVSKQNESVQAFPYEKKSVTYLLIAPYEKDKTRGEWWKKNKVHITKNPVKKTTLPNGFVVEKYVLTAEEIRVPAESDLITDLTFR